MADAVPASPARPHLQVRMCHRIGTLQLDAEFVLTQPWTILFGPSGCGKTTILRAIAGLLRPDGGRIASVSRPGSDRERVSVMVDTAEKCFVPAYKRRISIASQRSTLFPHRSVRENVLYGATSIQEDTPERSALPTTEATMELLRILPLAAKLPSALSGGEAQRVNLARAASAARGFLLLDEPFTGLHLALRSALMDDLKAWAEKSNLCVLSVTHDVAEAFHLGAEVIKIAEGRVVAQGPVEVVLAEERARLLRQLG